MMTGDQLERYKRNIFLREIGGPGQAKLGAAQVFVAGAGGLGSPALQYLAAGGVGTITVADIDRVDLSNLQRQTIFRTEDIGRPKVEAAASFIAAQNPEITLRPIEATIDTANVDKLIAGHDLVLDGTDNFASRRLINSACADAGIPLVSGAISQWDGQISLFDPAGGTPCFHCVFPNEPAAGAAPNCAEGGVIGALPGVVGAMMALEAIKHLTGAGQCLRGEMLIYDGLWAESRKVTIERNESCDVCARETEATACLA
jgi:molybdopterin/thiamine biosynthesis adenylyltransferase